ncbi:dihydrofolate reductase [Halalkalibacterium ligniniphilum]|uniref:dihydrofolate reductase n=1 Tax=Halalkalibacterium ligniniphilum TaxID=1134413 RepID=UPI0003452C6B|nr:dihydrofolate reductase [Halalkalibacterium ligniniphilum]
MISYIVAMDKQRAIGKDNQLPWHLPNDLAYFKKITTGHTIVMGRKTFESIGRPLPNRRNIVVTRNKSFEAEGVDVLHSIAEVVELGREEAECFVIGGAELFTSLWDKVERIYLTYIDETFEGDTFFPEIDENEWKLVSVEKGKIDENNRYAHEFRVYERLTETN